MRFKLYKSQFAKRLFKISDENVVGKSDQDKNKLIDRIIFKSKFLLTKYYYIINNVIVFPRYLRKNHGFVYRQT